jgi:hypothetical protein
LRPCHQALQSLFQPVDGRCAHVEQMASFPARDWGQEFFINGSESSLMQSA